MATFDFGSIEIDPFDSASISDAIMRINMIKSGLNRAAKKMHQYLLDEGVTIARFQIVRLCDTNKMSGDLWMSVKSSPEFVFDEETGKGIAYITAGDGLKTGKDGMSYAVYVEFGTGVHASENAVRERNERLRQERANGLYREISEPGKAMHFQDKDGKWHTSYGQPPKPFMRNTMYELASNARKKWAELLAMYLPHEG